EERITVFVTAVSLFRQFMKTLDKSEKFPHVRVVRLGAEAASADDVAAFRAHFADTCSLVHTFSASETLNIAQWSLAGNDPVTAGRLPAGRPVTVMEVLLLDDQGQEVAPGACGEIAVRSRFLSPGYWRDEQRTAERFCGAEGTNVRVYRSGDLGQ